MDPVEAINTDAIDWVFGDGITQNNDWLTRVIDLNDDPKHAAYFVLKYVCRSESQCTKLPIRMISCYEGS